MVADSIEVVSRSYQLEAQAARWVSTGSDTYTLESANKTDRGTVVTIKLNADSVEFAQEHRLRAIISKHSDYIPYPIYVGKDAEPVNRQMALWRKSPRDVEEAQYDDFYKQLTLDVQPPLVHTHMTVDAPVQMYALVYVPASAERNVFSSRRQDGLKLYARKVLIQDYCKDMLPEYLRFVQGVVDSEDLPLNVSRESVQSTRVMAQLKKLVTGRILDTLKNLAQQKPEEYEKFWKAFGRYIKEGLAMSEYENESALLELLRFATLKQTGKLISLAEYVQSMKVDQTKIYYIVGDDDRSIVHSPHLEAIRSYGYDVLLLTDPLDPFILLKVNQYKELPLVNVSSEDLKPITGGDQDKEKSEALPENDLNKVVEWFRHQLGEKVTGVRSTESLVESPARLVDEQGAMTPEMQHVYRLLDKQYDVPKKVLEINPRHLLLLNLNVLTEENPLTALIIDQIYEDALLIEGLLPDPANMIPRLQKIMEAALTKQA
jgi:HSP90 family molecular chaperone